MGHRYGILFPNIQIMNVRPIPDFNTYMYKCGGALL